MNKKKLLVAAITTLTFGLGINSVNANMIDTSYIQDSARAHKLIYGTDRNTKINKLQAKKLNKNRQSSHLNKVVLADSTDSLTETAMHGNGTLTFAPDIFTSGGGTIDDIRVASESYLAQDGHGTYNDLVTTKDTDHPDVVVINGTTYYFKAAESTDELTQDVRNLAATGARAITEVESTDNWIFSVGGKYYTYNKKQLPVSAYTISEVESTDSWNWTDGTKYYKLNVPGDSKRANAYTTLFDAEPADATDKTKGYISVNLPNNESRRVWYQYDTSKGTNERRNDDITNENVQNKVFAGISDGSNGGAISNIQINQVSA